LHHFARPRDDELTAEMKRLSERLSEQIARMKQEAREIKNENQ